MDAASLFNVKGKVVLVTGGGRGVGEMIASGYVSNGAKVYISSRDAKACEATSKRLSSSGSGKCIALPADLSKFEECERLVAELSKREEVLDILVGDYLLPEELFARADVNAKVNNSGVVWGAALEEYPDAAFTKVLTLNVQRVFTLTQKLLPLLRKGSERNRPSRIINIGSVNGVNVPAFETYAYSASKAALHQLSRHLAVQLGPQITVNTLALGPFRSKMMKATLDSIEADIADSLPMKRIGKPEDVAAACLWLSGKGGEWITGTTIPIEGGGLVSPNAKL